MNNKNNKDGIFLLNKEKGISSFRAINILKRQLNVNKVGHAGTLDPMAEGLMIVMLNDATKFSDQLMKKDKEYVVELEFGYETDTYDLEGEKTFIYENEFDLEENKDHIKTVINSFIGKINQIPPMYSAIKIDGKRMYEEARKGKEVEIPARKVEIYNIDNIKIYDKKISFVTSVSSGTYIRSLVFDIGRKLSYGATMTKLVRTKIDRYSLGKSTTLLEVENDITMSKDKIVNIESILDYESIYLNEYLERLQNGMTVVIKKDSKYFENIELKIDSNYKIYNINSDFIGIVKIIRLDNEKVYLKREKYFKNVK